MTFVDAESNRSRTACIMVVVESGWKRIQNLPNKITCGVKKNRVRTPLRSRRVQDTANILHKMDHRQW